MDAAEGVVSVNGKKLKFKPYPEPALFVAEKGVKVYSHELIVLPPRTRVGLLVCHQAVTRNEAYFFKSQDELKIEGKS